MNNIREILSNSQNRKPLNSRIAPIVAMGRPVKSKYTQLAESIGEPTQDWGNVQGGDIAAGLASGLKSYLGFRGAMQDAQNERAYNDYLAQLAERDRADKMDQQQWERNYKENALAQDIEKAKTIEANNEEQKRLNYIKLGINPDRLGEEGYLEQALASNQKAANEQIKGEFGYAMSVIQSPEFQNLPAEQQKLWKDFAATKARGLENVYAQAYQNALGAGAGKLQTAKELARQEAVGRQLLTQDGGALVPIAGSPEEVKRAEKRKEVEEMNKQLRESAALMNTQVNKALDLIDKSPISTTGLVGGFMKYNPYSDAGQLDALLNSIQNNIGLDKLVAVKKAGGTFGALSEKELQALQSSLGVLRQSGNPIILRQNLQNVLTHYNNLVNDTYQQKQAQQFSNVSDEDLLKGL